MKSISRRLALAILSVGALSSLPAATVSFTGSFTQDSQINLYTFSVPSTSTVTLLTYSYGGGTNGQGQVISRGGFEPTISLFSPAGTLLTVSGPNGSCPPQTTDSVSGICGDAYVQQSLTAGIYTAALTEFFNVANGPSLANGFLQQGTGNFTGPSCSVPGGSFLDETCGQRTSNFAIDFVNVQSAAPATASAVPEPGSFWLILPCAVLLGVASMRLSADTPAVRSLLIRK